MKPIKDFNKAFEHAAKESELAFINHMKYKGYTGCSLTINGTQTYISLQ